MASDHVRHGRGGIPPEACPSLQVGGDDRRDLLHSPGVFRVLIDDERFTPPIDRKQ